MIVNAKESCFYVEKGTEMKEKITMKQIAETLGISINAVSLALNDKAGVSEQTRKLVLDTAEKMGYLNKYTKYAQAYANKNICVLLQYRFFRDFRFYGRILLGIEESAKKSGYDVLINSFEKAEVPVCIKARKVSGIIVVGKIEDDFLHLLKGYGIPIVLADHVSMLETTDCVVSDNRFGTYQMSMYLIERGMEKIGYFGDIKYTPSTLDRFLGYQEAMQKAFHLGDFSGSMNYVKKFSVLSDVEEYVIKQESEKIYQAFCQIEERPEVLICSNDYLAISLIKALKKHGISVPEDIGVVGFDDIELCEMISPNLTTIKVQKKRMGEKAMQILRNRMERPKEKVEKIILEVEIVERDSISFKEKTTEMSS